MTIENNAITQANLLIVDDDQAIREALAEGLSLTGVTLQIKTAHNAAAGLQAALQQIPDLIIVDFNMPQGDGFALAREIRRRPELRETKILMLTAQDTHDKAWESVEHGIDAFIGKPFDMAVVEAHILSLLHRTLEKRPHRT